MLWFLIICFTENSKSHQNFIESAQNFGNFFNELIYIPY